MALTPEEQKKMAVAARHTHLLLDAFKFIIKAPDAAELPKHVLKNIEGIVGGGRKQLFFEKWSPIEPALPQQGFFAHYLRPSTLRYVPEKYQEPLGILARWQQVAEIQVENSALNLEKSFNTAQVLGALTDVQSRLMIDGGKNAFQILDASEPHDLKIARKRADKSNLTPEAYIAQHNNRIEEHALKSGLPVDSYLLRENHAVNRRKDVLQILVAEIADNVRAVQDVLDGHAIDGAKQQAAR